MPEEKRCKKCNKPIDEGELCSMCQMPRFEKRFSSLDMKELNRQADVFREDFRDKMKEFMKNETMQPPMPWSRD